DITERKQAEEKLRENEAKLSALFASMTEMVVLHEVVFDDAGKPVDYRITDCNPAFTNITGIRREDAVGKLATELYDTPHPPYLDEYSQVVITGKPYRYETYFEPMNKHFDISVVSHSKTRFATITTDITAQKELEASLRTQKEELEASNEEIKAMNEELRESMEEAREANKAKSEFLNTMSHELRTPLNGVIGFSEVLKSTELNPDQIEYVNTVLYSAHHLLEIISDILDLSRIEAGKLELRPEKVNLRALIEKTLSLIRNNAHQKGLKLSVDIPDNVPQTIVVDGLRLKQILLNLVSNAVKFTEEGGVYLTVSLVEQQEGQAALRFKVTDTGIGIKEEDQGLIFEPFQQLDMSSTRQYGGTGLGVTITNNLLQKMGSTLKLDSTYGEGSEFSFELVLPCGEESEKPLPDQAKTEEHPYSTPFKNKTILVAEDNQINMRYAVTALSIFSKDIHVIKAKDGKEAYELYLKHQPDLILMDIIMPGIDGYQATRMIRNRDEHIPIVAMTAKASKADKEACLKAGMNDFITKPVTLNQLKETVEKYL
ncbi:MAG: response regulator, partial [Thermotogota bacterium]|nr:response regulator [Thermotogota bacterium]